MTPMMRGILNLCMRFTSGLSIKESNPAITRGIKTFLRR
jgi:hypothetical protein